MTNLVTKFYIKMNTIIDTRIERVKSEEGNAIIVGAIAMAIFITASIALDTPIGNWIQEIAKSVMAWCKSNVDKLIK